MEDGGEGRGWGVLWLRRGGVRGSSRLFHRRQRVRLRWETLLCCFSSWLSFQTPPVLRPTCPPQRKPTTSVHRPLMSSLSSRSECGPSLRAVVADCRTLRPYRHGNGNHNMRDSHRPIVPSLPSSDFTAIGRSRSRWHSLTSATIINLQARKSSLRSALTARSRSLSLG